MEKVQDGDLMFYPHRPQEEQLSVVQITGEYDFFGEEAAIDGDFRAWRPGKLLTAKPLSMRTGISQQLRADLGRPGRFYQLHTQGELKASVRDFIRTLSESVPDHLFS